MDKIIKILEGVLLTVNKDDTCFGYDILKKYNLDIKPHTGEGFIIIEGIISKEDFYSMKNEIKSNDDIFCQASFCYVNLIPDDNLDIEDWKESKKINIVLF